MHDVDRPIAPRPLSSSELGDLLSRARLQLTVAGVETVWVEQLNGRNAGNPIVVLRLDQLALVGELKAMRERLSSMVDVLDEVASRPELWSAVGARRLSSDGLRGVVSRPFVRPARRENDR